MSDPSENDVATIAAAVAAATEDEKASVAVAAAAVAAAAAAAAVATDDEDGTAGDWDNLTDNGGEEEEEGAQALLELRKQKRKNKKRKRKTTKKKETDDDEEDAEAGSPVKIAKVDTDISVDDIAPELRDVDLPEEKRKIGNSETTNASNNTTTSNNASSSNNNDNTFETDLQEFFSHPDNPNWQRFYADSITDDAANQVDLNMLIEEQNFNSHQLKKRSKRSVSNVDPALEQLDDDNSPLEMTTKEQSQLEDAMMHASAIVRTLESGGSQPNFDGILLNEKKKRKNSNSASYDDDLLNEAIKYARSNTELNFEDQGNGTGATDTPSANTVANPISSAPKTNKRKVVQGDLAAISVAKDPSLLNPMRNSLGFNKKDKDSISPVSSPASPPAPNTSTAPSSATNTGVTSDPATAGGLMDDNNWRYVSLSGDSGPKNAAASAGLGSTSHQASLLTTDSFKRLNWTGNGNQHGGSFSQHEVDLIDEFMMRYCHMNSMTREDLCKRVWSNERRKDNFWDDVANILPTRTRASVYKHIRRAYHVFKARGKWTPEEDKELGDLVEEKGKLWKQIGLTLCRMPEDCRDRWRNYVKCGEKRVQNKWGVDEEERLREVVTHIMTTYPGHDINWTEVSDMMGGTRSRIQCRYKWTKMVKRAAMAKIDAMMPGDKISLLQFLKQSGYEDESQVDWDGFAALDSRGFWTGKELQVAFESQRAKILDGNNKDFRQVVDELLTELLILPEHRRREKYRGGFETDITGVLVSNMEPPSVDGATSAQSEDGAANTNEKVGSTDPVKHEKKQKSQLELTDDLVAVAAAAAAAMQEDKKASTTVTSSITSTSNGSVASTSASAAIAAAALAKAKKRDTNNNIYGTPPTALLYKQSKKNWGVPGSTVSTITTSSSIPSSSATSSSAPGN
ncbi:hypothetical protein D0Z00_002199 [Geotrichum galactomycetum]|uniref:Uncharacterized protein n=1 Tax=Geotrichum galactomycetum TaxID=27317 RepID=A0ACB6V4W2_9ASCO|nr:hypothetical protein D0Z00_002199 [Geotrichum candidum]